MREEKKLITKEYVERLNASPYFIVVNYEGLKVAQFEELRNRLASAGAEVHVFKNSIFKAAAKEAGIQDLGQELTGQLAAVTGEGEIAGAAKMLKNFRAGFIIYWIILNVVWNWGKNLKNMLKGREVLQRAV